MTNRLGSGEYEAVDVEVRESTLEARRIFFNVLYQQKGFWLKELLALYNEKEIPEDVLKSTDEETIIRFFLPFFTSKQPYPQKIPSSNTNTPFINFCWYLLDKEDEIKVLEEKAKSLNDYSDLDPVKCRARALEKIVLDWNNLKTQPNAIDLRNSLEHWAAKWNLTNDWCIDFALNILCNFKAYMDIEFKIYEKNNQTSRLFLYDWAIKEVLPNILRSYIWKSGWSIFEDMNIFPDFEYKWGSFEKSFEAWLPSSISESSFKDIIKKELDQTLFELNEFWKNCRFENQHQFTQIIESQRKKIGNYWDYLDKNKKQGISDFDLSPYNFQGIIKISPIISEKNREVFINTSLKEIEKRIIKINQSVKSLKTFTKSHFNKKLKEYICEIRKSLPSNWEKTPKKYSQNRHFEWLIEFQLASDKTYRDIANQNNIDESSVRESVKELAKILGITLKKAKKPGRPKNSKNNPNSLRQLGIFK